MKEEESSAKADQEAKKIVENIKKESENLKKEDETGKTPNTCVRQRPCLAEKYLSDRIEQSRRSMLEIKRQLTTINKQIKLRMD